MQVSPHALLALATVSLLALALGAPVFAGAKGSMGIAMPTAVSARSILDGALMAAPFAATGDDTDLHYGSFDSFHVGAQPKWFYKGNGSTAIACGQLLTSPGFARDGGKAPEWAGIHLVAPDGTAVQLGWALSNAFSDHAATPITAFYRAHSKLRHASWGPEILRGDLPTDRRASLRLRRGDAVIFEKPFLSGAPNMSHTLANLAHHPVKYVLFRQAGDLHVYMFGNATLSFADDIAAQAGDVFEIEAARFGLPLTNPLALAVAHKGAVTVRQS